MARPSVKDKKLPKSLSIRQSDFDRFMEAASKMKLPGMNAFVELAANQLADQVLDGKGTIDALSHEVESQRKEINLLRKDIRSLVRALASEAVEA